MMQARVSWFKKKKKTQPDLDTQILFKSVGIFLKGFICEVLLTKDFATEQLCKKNKTDILNMRIDS